MNSRHSAKLSWLLLVMTLIAVGPVLLAQTNATSTLIIKIVGARNTKGKIGVALFKSAEGFPQDESKMFQPKSMVIDQKTMSAEAVYTNLPPGTYAVVARHDENNNMKLDKNLFGIPTEGYAISNNPKPRLRAPHWDEASFVLKSPTQSVEVKLLYR